jgi:epoxyqueuosine reductase
MEKAHEYLAISEPDAERIKCNDGRYAMILPESLQPLEEIGHRLNIVSIRRLPLLQQRIRELHRKGVFEAIFFKENLTEFRFDPPAGLPDAKSLLIVATPQPISRISFHFDQKPFPVLIPPTYTLSTDDEVGRLLKRCLGPQGYRVLKALIPLKSLAAYSGLAKYGKNNIAYVPGMGSFFRLSAFYSDFPCHEDTWVEPQMLDRCRSCKACQRCCPAQAIPSRRFLLRAERCMTYHNESRHDFPAWLDPEWHHCLVGCLSCQTSCPENKAWKDRIEDAVAFSEAESRSILEGKPISELPDKTREKLERLGMTEYIEILPRNLRALLDNNGL